MKVKLSTGVILESDNESVYSQLLAHGGKEVTDEVTSEKPASRRSKANKDE